MGLTEKQGKATEGKALQTTNFGKKQEEFNSVFANLMKKKREERQSRLVLGIWGEPKTGKTLKYIVLLK